jgi:hypothetical protein
MGAHIGEPSAQKDPVTGRIDYFGRMVIFLFMKLIFSDISFVLNDNKFKLFFLG